ncbi:DUF5644 domain-containing protein [Helicobacter sp. 11S03491-1]|uniref:DUF5644 domain-containing protein n=1 Tax=Helicobacter sp. 11S03491-1 TaxID=1476196 RepID=UPI000BA64D39|nr:DUF5644 domain-containing protein [Helicobacter sp. 11S03491-1]PAF41457.1 hypothetical protein BKH45_06970 [Helicobacter sp. 11S03491-1]
MSIHKLELSVFRFEAQKSYSPIYEKCTQDYRENFTLLDVLKNLPLKDFQYDPNIALKINNIAIFKDIGILELVQRFGKEWVIEPISTKYAYKDLLIDKNAVLSFYDSFMQSGDFLTQSEKTELTRFIYINFISPQRNPDYFGDGFFLYVKWLLMRHPNDAKRLIQSIADCKNGVMNFVSVAKFVYPENNQIDSEIFELQKMLTQASKCPLAQNNWIKFVKNIESKYNFPSQNNLENSLENSSKYALFNGYDKSWNFKPLLISTASLLEKFHKSVLPLEFCYDGGYWGRFCDEEKFLFANAYNMALAYKNNAILLLCEEDAYANIMYAKSIIDADNALRDTLNKKLKQFHLVYDCKVVIESLNQMLANEVDWDVIQSFKDFGTVVFEGSFYAHKICYKKLFEKISLKKYQTTIQNECYAHLFEVNQHSALEQSGRIRYEAIDLGIDFLVSTSMGQFEMFDTYSKKASKQYKRDFDSMPTLFLSQIVLIAMGEKDFKKLGLHLHKNKVTFI